MRGFGLGAALALAALDAASRNEVVITGNDGFDWDPPVRAPRAAQAPAEPTAHDHERIRRAEQKRARKAAKLAAIAKAEAQ